MKIIIFAGGAGTRLWPLSRKNSPKQFGQIFDGKSTLQLTVERVEKGFPLSDIYISTNEKYVSKIKEQLPKIPSGNIIAEPEKRDVAPAIGYCFMKLKKAGYKGPVAIVWADHTIQRNKEFVNALKKGEQYILDHPDKLFFMGEKPRFANHNLGWIHLGPKIKDSWYHFLEWHYRPPLEKCKQMFNSGEWYWNPGYFVLDLNHTLQLYSKFVPDMYEKLLTIATDIGTVNEQQTLRKMYPLLESISFDNAIIEKTPSDQAVVYLVDMGWADPGTLYALKESLTLRTEDSYTKGLSNNLNINDCLIINEDENKLISVIGAEGLIVINTKDALVVVHKDQVPDVKKMVEKLSKDKKFKRYI